MIQVLPFNQSKGGTIPNFCLANVCAGYGIRNKYASAWQAWLNTEQHSGEPPAGLDVPVFFSYTATIDGINQNWGHIGVRLSNGQFWTDGRYFPTIAAYTANHFPKYVGWGESVNNVTVIKDNSMAIIENADNWRGRAARTFRAIRGRDMGAGEFEPWVGQDFLHLVEALEDNPETDQNIADGDLGRVARKDDWQGQIKSLQDRLSAAEVDGTNWKTHSAELEKKIAALQAQLDQDKVTATPPLSNDQVAAATGVIAFIKRLLGIK